MKIAVLGWGSICWKNQTLQLDGSWKKDGPILSIEFSRITDDKVLVPVIDEIHGAKVPTRWAVSSFQDLTQAIINFRDSEGMMSNDRVGFIDLIYDISNANVEKSHPVSFNLIREWAIEEKLDAVVWLGLESNFKEKSGEEFSVSAAARYYGSLTDPAKSLATECLEKATPEINTPVRRLLWGHVASPASTGGAGTVLEHRYGASCLVLLLCHGELPFYSRSEVETVTVQARSLRWRTDDVLVEGKLPNQKSFRLALQVKRTCAPVASDTEFTDFIENAWADFVATDRFAPDSDRLVLVSTYQSGKLQRFRQLIEQSQATTSAGDWIRKLAIPNFLSSEVGEVKNAILVIIKTAFSTTVSDSELWAFLRCCGVFLTDLDTEGSSQQSHVIGLLRTTAIEPDTVAAATNTWIELLALTSFEAGKAKTFRFIDLPEHLRQRHGRSTVVDHKLRTDLERDSATVLARSRDSIQGTPIERATLESQIASDLSTHRVVLVTGPAGSGKSAVAKRVFQAASHGSFALAFNAEEFAAVNLRSAPAMHGVDLAKFAELSAFYSKRLVLIESVERLLEDSRRDAFLDFLRQIASDPSWYILFTCRSSASITVEMAFLEQAGLKGRVLEVPPLSDPELSQISTKLPKLIRPFSSPTLKKLLRQPFLLEKAASLDWPESEPLPTAERQFRGKVWSEIVRKNSLTTGGLPQRRSDTFIEVALKRARGLMPFVPASGFDAEAIQKLHDDDLITRSRRSDALIAPAHDMLEDWALLQWLDERYYAKEEQLLPLVESLEPFPALRRAYRKWLAEWIEAAPEQIGPNAIVVMRASSLAQQWRDESIATVMRSSHASSLITANASALLEHEGDLLFRCIHLCRVAATARSNSTPLALGRLSMGRVPDGAGWNALAELLLTNKILINSEGRFSLVSNFIEDWSRCITGSVPYPQGASTFAEIALDLIEEKEDEYRISESVNRLAQAVIKMPLASKERFIKQVKGIVADQNFERHGRGLAELTLDHFYNSQLCRDLPDIVIECINAYLYKKYESEEEDKHPFSYGRQEKEEIFGLRPFLRMDGATVSAFKGPFLNLLFSHPEKGLDLIISILNRTAISYQKNANFDTNYMEPPSNVLVEFPDGTRRSLISSEILWSAYRGAGTLPYVLQSALMALESWLLIQAERKNHILSHALNTILSKANNVALISVIASVATAYPSIVGISAYTILTVPDFFHFDIQRFVQEASALENMFGGYSTDEFELFFNSERRSSRALPHRKLTIHDLCRSLQSTAAQDRIWSLIDNYRIAAGGDNPSDVESAIWLKMLNDMDLRTFVPAGRDGNRLYFAPKELSSGINEKLNEQRPVIEAQQKAMTLAQWGKLAFDRKLSEPQDTTRWKEMLAQALLTPFSTNDDTRFETAGASFVAVIALRDHWSELTAEQLEWCIRRVTLEILKDSDNYNEFHMRQNHTMNGDRPAAYIISQIFARHPDNIEIKKIVAIALTHPTEQVRVYALLGFRQVFAANRPDFFRHVLNALASGVDTYRSLQEVEKKKAWNERRNHMDVLRQTLLHVRTLIESEEIISSDVIETLRFDDEGSYVYFSTIASWLCEFPESKITEHFFTRNISILVEAWISRSRSDRIHTETVSSFEQQAARYILISTLEIAIRIVEVMVKSTPKASERVGMFLWTLVLATDVNPAIDRFWNLWTLFANEAKKIPTAQFKGSRNEHGRLLSKLFLYLENNSEPEVWPLVVNSERRILELYSSLPACADSTILFLTYLKKFGHNVVPQAFISIAAKVMEDPTEEHLTANVCFVLEQILSVRVFATPVVLKSTPEIREAVLYILDALVNRGSAAAFIMRDDFATPLRP